MVFFTLALPTFAYTYQVGSKEIQLAREKIRKTPKIIDISVRPMSDSQVVSNIIELKEDEQFFLDSVQAACVESLIDESYWATDRYLGYFSQRVPDGVPPEILVKIILADKRSENIYFGTHEEKYARQNPKGSVVARRLLIKRNTGKNSISFTMIGRLNKSDGCVPPSKSVYMESILKNLPK